MYICLEGIKGTGKSSVYEQLKRKIETMELPYTTICPTKPISGFDIREMLTRRFEFLRNNIFWSKWIYSHRSNFSARKALKEKKPLILGDRSKLTSYVVRRMQGMTWEAAFKVIDKTEKYIPLPDIVVYFQIEPTLAYERIKRRKNHFGNRQDETLEALVVSKIFYEELRENKTFGHLSNIEWIDVNGQDDPEEIAEQTINIIAKSLKQIKL